jgi:S-adenosylmethionine-dependent methyltransferase
VPDDVKDIQVFYDRAVEEENGRLERHQLERDITWRYLDKYLPPRGKILEVGAGTGAYSWTCYSR